MAFTKIAAAGIGTTERVTVDGLTVINNLSVGGTVSIAGTLTYEDVTNVDAVGLITARGGIVVGSGITLSKDGDIFATGITTVSGNVKVGTGITLSPDGDGFYTGVVTATTFDGALAASNLTGALPAISGANLTGMAAGGAFVKGVIGVTTLTPVGIETSTVTRKDLIGPAGNTSTGAGSSFHGAYMGDGFLSFNTEFSNPTGYYISTFTNALVAGPMQLGSTLTIDGNFTIV